MLTIFNGTVRLPDDYYQKNKVPILPLRYGLGHPVDYHPVSDVMDPANQSKVKTPLSCLSCHQATCFGAARSAGQGPGKQHGVLRQLPQEPAQHERDGRAREIKRRCATPMLRAGQQLEIEMFRFLFNSIRTRNRLSSCGVFCWRLSLAVPLTADRGQKKEGRSPRLRSRRGRANLPSIPTKLVWPSPPKHRAHPLARLLCRRKDRLHTGSAMPSQGKLDGPAGRRTVGCGEDQSQDFPFQMIGPYGIAIDSAREWCM